MIRTQCITQKCRKTIRARKVHKFCRTCHFSTYGVPRSLSRQTSTKTKVIKTKPVVTTPTKRKK